MDNLQQQMTKIILILLLIYACDCQSQTTLTQPSLIQTNTYTLRKERSSITNLSTNITYMQNYTYAPLVFVSIVNMHSFTMGSVVSFTQSVQTITKTYFTISYVSSCLVGVTSCSFSEIVICYLAFDFNSYPYVQILQSTLTLDAAITLQNQYHQVQYLQHLNNHYNYSLNCMLTGFQTMLVTGQPYLYINAVQNDFKSYYFNIEFYNITVVTVDYLRILIDVTTMDSMSTGISSLTCDMGSIYHYSDPNIVQDNPTPDFLPFAMFFGVSGLASFDISLTSFTYIFNNTYPRIHTKISYVLFITKSCPTSQLYVSSQNLCYGLSSAFYYQATPATMQPCPYSCYQCVGPLTTQCKSCVTGWNRVLSSGRCVCISGFYDPGGPQCKNCTQAISGCKTCSSATNCLTCLAGCTAIGFSPIYCDCPSHVQQNYSYNCLKSFYFDYSINTCTCLPQTYYDSSANMCFPCSIGCYICAKNSSYCLACIDSYTLIKNTCTFYPISYSLMGQSSNYNSPKIRCLRWDSSNSVCIQKCKYYYYQSNCYSKCPLGTFNISFPWLTCQPCQLSCQYCFNYTICYQCSTTYYYFNTSILSCSPCSSKCVKCTNATYCTQCQDLYLLVNNSCQLPTITSPVCPIQCSFCLISNQCLKCKIPYFLNLSSQTCIECSLSVGLQMWADGCHEICGDGKSINSECDDGNTVSGDGCSSQCTIQSGYVCNKKDGKSYCWSRAISLDWQIISVIGANQVIISLHSNSYPLSKALLSIQCGFKFSLMQRATVKGREELTLSYQESIILMQLSAGNNNTIDYFSGNMPKTVCQLLINNQQNVTILLNKKPTPLMINYNSQLQSSNNGKTFKTMSRIAIFFSLITSVLAISPMTSYSCLRLYILLFASYIDYMHTPINGFAPYQSLSQLLFLPSSTTTRQLQIFTSEYFVNILWHLVVMYVSMAIWLQIMVPFTVRLCKNMDWTLLSRIFSLISQNKAVAYQNMYISYEVIIFILIAKTIYYINDVSPALIALAIIHFMFIVGSKFHFWFTFEQLKRLYPQYNHALVIEQIQNISIAALILATTSKSSFTPILMIVFGLYPLLSVDRNTQSPIKGGHFYITNQMSIWQLKIGYIFHIIIQLLRLANMWIANLPLTLSAFESASANLGLSIGLITSIFMFLSWFTSCIAHLIRICQIKTQGRATIPSMEDVEADVSSNPQ